MTTPEKHPAEPADPADPEAGDTDTDPGDGFWSGDDTSQTAAQHAETRRTTGTDDPAGDPTTTPDQD